MQKNGMHEGNKQIIGSVPLHAWQYRRARTNENWETEWERKDSKERVEEKNG